MQDYTKKYLNENIPYKSYVRKKRLIIRPRKKNEIFFAEVLFTIMLIAMLLILAINSQNYYQPGEKTEVEKVDIEVDINEDSLYSPSYTTYESFLSYIEL